MFAITKNTLIFVLASSFIYPYLLLGEIDPPQPLSGITVLGSVYCDVCFANTFTKHSYFLPGVNVHVECKFKASPPGTTEQISFSVNRTTDAYGVYKLEIPAIDGVDCRQDPTIQSFCKAKLISSQNPHCKTQYTRSTSSEITVKSKQNNVCTFSLGALSFKPSKKNVTLCTFINQELELAKDGLNSSKTFFLPPYFFPWPHIPQLPPLPPFPSFPFPSFPYPPSPNPPSLPFPFPFPPLTPYVPPPALISPPPTAFNWSDPKTWIPNNPLVSPPPPPPPAFNFWDPRTWTPAFPPSPPSNSDSQFP